MTNFTKTNLVVSGDTVVYMDGSERKFVLRSKKTSYIGGKVNFLIKNFTVEDFFAAREAGLQPLTVLESKGYILPHIKKWLKENNLPVSVDSIPRLIQIMNGK